MSEDLKVCRRTFYRILTSAKLHIGRLSKMYTIGSAALKFCKTFVNDDDDDDDDDDRFGRSEYLNFPRDIYATLPIILQGVKKCKVWPRLSTTLNFWCKIS